MLIYAEHVSRLLRDCDYCCTMPYIAVQRVPPYHKPYHAYKDTASHVLCVHSDGTQLTGVIFLIHDPFCACVIRNSSTMFEWLSFLLLATSYFCENIVCFKLHCWWFFSSSFTSTFHFVLTLRAPRPRKHGLYSVFLCSNL